MDRNKLIERLMATFRGELEEHVRNLNEGLLTLEKDPAAPGRVAVFKTLLRVAHSLKGAARSVGMAAIEEACHRVEEILTAARDGRRALDAERFALLFATADAIEEAGVRLREQEDLADSPLSRLLPKLEAEAAGALSGALPLAQAAAPVTLPAMPKSLVPVPQPASPAPAPRVLDVPGTRSMGADGPGPEHLPALESAPAQAPSALGAAVEPERHATSSDFVRIPAEKLDAMLACSGELLVARRCVELRAGELASIRDAVARWRSEWHGAEKALAKLVPRERAGGAGAGPGDAGDHDDRDNQGRDRERAASDPLRAPIPRYAAEVLGQVGERLSRMEHDLDRFVTAIGAGTRQLERAALRLDDEVRRVRMLPFAEACQGLERTVRDVARTQEKQVELVIEGGDVELDRSVLEGLRDPLNHLVRNAVDHGIESPDRRQAAGKPGVGRVTVAAALHGTQVEVVVADDGQGLDLDAVRSEARRRGLVEPKEERDLADLIFLPGFSTTRIVTSISGRGVGLDVVKSRLEELHGSVELGINPGQGTYFTLAVPLTLTTLRALLFGAGGQTFALAGSSVPKLVRVDPRALRTIEGRTMLISDGAALPVVELVRVLGLPPRPPASTAETAPARTAASASNMRPGLIIAAGERRVAFLVDELITEQEIIVKNLGKRLKRVRHAVGATILADGRIAPVLNAANLVRSALGQPAQGPGLAGPPDAAPDAGEAAHGDPAPAPGARKRLLVVDDSVTTRTLEKSILEAAGYEVLAAVDGEAAWRLLQERGADLVVSDVEMPHKDGFELTETIRHSTRFAELPVVLLTARASDRDRARGAEVGADAYIVKSSFDQSDLIKTIAQLL
jgi:two-component system chemotaxis sensor kinase CheA